MYTDDARHPSAIEAKPGEVGIGEGFNAGRQVWSRSLRLASTAWGARSIREGWTMNWRRYSESVTACSRA